MKINVRSNVDEVVRGMTGIYKRQLPYATSLAINEVAEKAGKAIKQEILRAVDNPVPYTKNSTFVVKSNKNKRPITAIVGVKDRQANYLKYVEEGGESRPLSGKAKPVPRSSFKNKEGNIPRGKISKLLNTKTTVFSGTPPGRSAGVYQRMGTKNNRKLRMLATWHSATHHTKRSRIGERVRTIVSRNMGRALRRAMTKAIATAR